MSNMYKDAIKRWNPYAGCGFGCIYCEPSFQRQAKRQKQRCMKCYTYEPHLHEERLSEDMPKTDPREFIFVGGLGDVSFCPTDYFKKVLDTISSLPNKTFLFQSKNPATFRRVEFPNNVLLGITLETNKDDLTKAVSRAPVSSKRYNDFQSIEHPRKMITIEPIMQFDQDIMIDWIGNVDPELVWMGYDTRKCHLPEPSLEEFYYLKLDLESIGYTVIEKYVRFPLKAKIKKDKKS